MNAALSLPNPDRVEQSEEHHAAEPMAAGFAREVEQKLRAAEDECTAARFTLAELRGAWERRIAEFEARSIDVERAQRAVDEAEDDERVAYEALTAARAMARKAVTP